ncbi:hypothetical protein PHLCEN_2v3556 [Hermanssonia centrifuga]|uniref:Uncharacterized protein n=1 Tax=Hermanssonia centrifuga TaxID=98765 RepID=A0A2R6QET7_9APHY|nr:hypothetical protein PHLCEN_2v3556 [Hermanssonia centrifuga]
MPTISYCSRLRQVEEGFTLSLNARYTLLAGSPSATSIKLKGPIVDADILLNTDLVLTLSGILDGTKICNTVVKESYPAKHLLNYLRANANSLGFGTISDIYTDDEDNLPKCSHLTRENIAANLSYLVILSSAYARKDEGTSKLYLQSIDLVYVYRTKHRDNESNAKVFQAACHIPKADPELYDDESFVPPEDPFPSIPGGQYFDEMHWGNEYTAGELHGDSCWLDAVPEDTDGDEADWLFDCGSTALNPSITDCGLDATESTDSDSLLTPEASQIVAAAQYMASSMPLDFSADLDAVECPRDILSFATHSSPLLEPWIMPSPSSSIKESAFFVRSQWAPLDEDVDHTDLDFVDEPFPGLVPFPEAPLTTPGSPQDLQDPCTWLSTDLFAPLLDSADDRHSAVGRRVSESGAAATSDDLGRKTEALDEALVFQADAYEDQDEEYTLWTIGLNPSDELDGAAPGTTGDTMSDMMLILD